jgi:hypothetical protein
MKFLGLFFLLLGSLSIIYNKAGANSYAEFQKGWGLEGQRAIFVGRLIGIMGGLLVAGLGLLMLLK